MNCVRFVLFASSLGLSAATNVHAQIDLDSPEIARTIRAKYVQSADLPDGVAFYTILSNLSEMNKVDRESAIGSVQRHMRLSQFEAEQFLERLLGELALIANEHDNITRNLACRSGSPALARDQIFPIFEALDDAWTTLGARHLANTKEELDQESASKLQAWVESKKLSITHVSFRQKEHWEQTGGNPNNALGAICDGLNDAHGVPPK